MRAVVQRVKNASVVVDGEVISEIGKGLCVLVGIKEDDTKDDAEMIRRRILTTRFFPDPDSGKMWAKSVKDLGLEVLLVSQFTLYGKNKGTKIDFHRAMAGHKAEEEFEHFVQSVKNDHAPELVKGGYEEAL